VSVLDKTNSYKIVGGRLVERTAEELARLKRLKIEQFARERTSSAKKWMPRSTDWFVKVILTQTDKLLQLDPVCCPLFLILLVENFRHKGRPFILPTRKLNTVKGLRPTNLRSALIQLERCGLIAVARRRPRPPLITVM
jgi:hypothetical protein